MAESTDVTPPKELLEDLCSRFLLNVPAEELKSFDRMLFLIEQAHWFYEDNIREDNPKLKSYGLREFTSLMFHSCSALQQYISQVDNIYKDFRMYKGQVPTTGAIILNSTYDKVLLVKGWKASSSWGFPKGKKNKDEEDEKCAVREVLEETGIDISNLIRSDSSLEINHGQQRSRLFVVSGLPEDVKIEPRTKKEISEIAWHPIDLISGIYQADGISKSRRYFLVHPYIRPLKEWLVSRRLLNWDPQKKGPQDISWVYKVKVNQSAPVSPTRSPRISRTASGEVLFRQLFSPEAISGETPKSEEDHVTSEPQVRNAGKGTRRSLLPLLTGDPNTSEKVFPFLSPVLETASPMAVSTAAFESAGKCLREFKLEYGPILDCLKF